MSRRLDPRVLGRAYRKEGGKPPTGKGETVMVKFKESCAREVKRFEATRARDEHKWMFINGHVRSVSAGQRPAVSLSVSSVRS